VVVRVSLGLLGLFILAAVLVGCWKSWRRARSSLAWAVGFPVGLISFANRLELAIPGVAFAVFAIAAIPRCGGALARAPMRRPISRQPFSKSPRLCCQSAACSRWRSRSSTASRHDPDGDTVWLVSGRLLPVLPAASMVRAIDGATRRVSPAALRELSGVIARALVVLGCLSATQGLNPRSISSMWWPGLASYARSLLPDLRRIVPISGRPEIGGLPRNERRVAERLRHAPPGFHRTSKSCTCTMPTALRVVDHELR